MIVHDRPNGSGFEPIGVRRDEALKTIEYAIDCPQDCFERIPDWENLIRRNDAPLKRYVEGKFCLHAHLWIWATGIDRKRDPGNYRIVVGSALRGKPPCAGCAAGTPLTLTGVWDSMTAASLTQ